MIIETIIISLFLGKIKKGKIKNILYLDLKKISLLVLAFVANIFSIITVSNFSGSFSKFIVDNFALIHIFIYGLFLSFLYFNLKEKGIKTIFLGSFLNFLALVFNKGKMPISSWALIFSGLHSQLGFLGENKILTHTLINKETSLKIFSDIIPIPKPYLFPKIISFGDILISIGLYYLITTYMVKKDSI